MPSEQPEDRRKASTHLTQYEIRDRVSKSHEEAKRYRNQTKGGFVVGIVGVMVAGYAGLVNDNLWMTITGFSVGLLGFGLISPREVAAMVRSFFGRNGRNGGSSR